ncbi:Rhodanese-related sulfurtransferase [Cribrihabitans marinus]|uniref:Rhodanese-related sulfurtransferase n=1 Tax=Cribrihabitans marinus TaxID=1227549 RepID=A0A1H7DBT7_9RHOB|nr:rhodanese family protein [Cribrihabitans marinus]GGH38377.1 inner membrane protein YgaP [Cribrihabitans marinus]SEJ98794.1 Rhodanese-related sulfurtransferase [Cribrihabitans marinus]
MTLKTIDPQKTHDLLASGEAVLIDVREPDEWIKEHIPEAHLVPLSGFNADDFPRDHDKIAVFHCRSGGRTEAAAPQILRTGFRETYQLKGGIQGWREAGYKVNETAKAPISIMRQVQITAGSLVLLGIVLAVLVNPWFAALSALVGAGLTQAGLTGTCAMASMLKHMPWNRVMTGQQAVADPATI